MGMGKLSIILKLIEIINIFQLYQFTSSSYRYNSMWDVSMVSILPVFGRWKWCKISISQKTFPFQILSYFELIISLADYYFIFQYISQLSMPRAFRRSTLQLCGSVTNQKEPILPLIPQSNGKGKFFVFHSQNIFYYIPHSKMFHLATLFCVMTIVSIPTKQTSRRLWDVQCDSAKMIVGEEVDWKLGYKMYWVRCEPDDLLN